MRLGKDLLKKPIYARTNGRLLGYVKDVYLNPELNWIAGLYLDTEGLIRRKDILILREQIAVLGIDAILVNDENAITDSRTHKEAKEWIRLEQIFKRGVDTPGGTKVGTIGDIILTEEGDLYGFSLARVFVEGPIANNGTVPRPALIDTGNEDGQMTIDLPKLEKLYQQKDSSTAASETEAA